MGEGERTATATTTPASPGSEASSTEDDFTRSLVADRYELERRIGSGGMGVVYAGRDIQLGRPVAIKLVGPRAGPGASRNRLVREARAMARLRHPNVVTVFDIVAVSDRLFIVMELVEGGTLSDWLKAERRSWRQIVPLFLQAARGLCAAHAAGIVHRDFKPENVLVGSDGVVRVTDFGVVRLIGDVEQPIEDSAPGPVVAETGTGALVGTPGYIAPEILRRQAVDARADQFSFCVALHSALHGERPFEPVEGPNRTAETLGKLRLKTKRHVPRAVRRTIVRGLSHDAAHRWPTMEALSRALERRLWWTPWILALLASALLAIGAILAFVVTRPPTRDMPMWNPTPLLQANAGGLRDVVVSPDGKIIAYVGFQSVAIEPREGGDRRHIAAPSGFDQIEWVELDAGADSVYARLLKDWNPELWEIPTASGTGTRRLPLDSGQGGNFHDWAVGKNGDLLVVVDAKDAPESQLARVSRSGDWSVLVQTSPGARIGTPAWSRDAKRAAIIVRSSTEERVEIIDIVTKQRSVLARRSVPVPGAPWRLRQVTWLGPDSIACIEVRDGMDAVTELDVHTGIVVDRYVTQPYERIAAMRGTDAGVLLRLSNGRPSLAMVDLEKTGPSVAIDTGSLADFPPAGWVTSRGIVFGANMRGRMQMMSLRPDGRVDALHHGTAAEIPLALVGDAIIFGRFPSAESIYLKWRQPEEGELFRLEPDGSTASLGPVHGFLGITCARDPARRCLLSEHAGDVARSLEWDSQTGALGQVVLEWKHDYQKSPGRLTPELAPDGHTVARVSIPEGANGGDVELLDLATGTKRTLALPQTLFQVVAWQEDDVLVASGFFPDGNGLAKVHLDGRVEGLAPAGWLLGICVAPDRKKAIVVTVEGPVTFSWVER